MFQFFCVVPTYWKVGESDLRPAMAKVLVRVQKITGEEIEIHVNPEDRCRSDAGVVGLRSTSVRRIRQISMKRYLVFAFYR